MQGPDAELHLAWERAAGRHPASTDLLEQVVGRYREAHRRYHGVSHLVWVVRHVHQLAATDEVAAEAPDVGAIVMAAFFHDAVYDPTRHDNEAQSANLAGLRLAELAELETTADAPSPWTLPRRALVVRLVEATAHLLPVADEIHDGDAMERDVLLDADLAILGAEPAAYAAYVTGVRGEYAHLDDDAWREGRAAVLRRLLEPEHRFRTVPGRAWWERRAVANLTAELASLQR